MNGVPVCRELLAPSQPLGGGDAFPGVGDVVDSSGHFREVSLAGAWSSPRPLRPRRTAPRALGFRRAGLGAAPLTAEALSAARGDRLKNPPAPTDTGRDDEAASGEVAPTAPARRPRRSPQVW